MNDETTVIDNTVIEGGAQQSEGKPEAQAEAGKPIEAGKPAESVPAATTEPPAFDIKLYEKADVVTIATAMATALTDEIKYKLAKLMLERTKTVFIDPMKDIREKEKADEQKAAEQRAAAVAEYRDRLVKLLDDEVMDDFATIATDYIEAGHGALMTVEIFAKKDPETGKVKAEFNSNVAKPRSRQGVSTRTRESGASGAGVIVSGKAKEGVTGPTLESPKTYKSFADAARELGFVDDSTEMKGLNCKRLLEKKGYECGYVPTASAPAPTGTVVPETVQSASAPVVIPTIIAGQ